MCVSLLVGGGCCLLTKSLWLTLSFFYFFKIPEQLSRKLQVDPKFILFTFWYASLMNGSFAYVNIQSMYLQLYGV